MIKVIALDLDDTLYSELEYVRSGLREVAEHLAGLGLGSKNKILDTFLAQLAVGRSEIFDRGLKEIGQYRKSLVKECVSIYRSHRPELKLWPGVGPLLKSLSQRYKLYIVTDGHKGVQRIKLASLELLDAPEIQKCFITYQYGRVHSKPSPYCFEKICQLEKVSPEQVVYVGDNISKDFVGIKPLGFRTVRVLTGQHAQLKADSQYLAEREIPSVVDLPQFLQEESL